MLRLRLSRLLLLLDPLLVHLPDGYDPSASWVEQMHVRVDDDVSLAVIVNVVRRREVLNHVWIVKYAETGLIP